MSNVKGILIRANVYDKKDNQGKGLSLEVLVEYDNINNINSGKVINLYAGKSYVGGFDFENFKRFEEIDIEYNQPIGSQYPQLVNVHKIIKK